MGIREICFHEFSPKKMYELEIIAR